MKEPHTPHPHRHLLMTVGRTPQVVTETLYALATRPDRERFVPTEVHLITTEEGRRQSELELLDSGHARIAALCAELGLERSQLRFDSSTIHLIRDAAGQPLEDIRSVGDNMAGADAIVSLVRSLTARPDSALHVSLAGGRKTMGFYLGYALSLFGRPQDRLSHVLVDPRFENLPDFFHPTRQSKILRLRDGRGTVDARHARVELADIPVVSLRGLLGAELLGSHGASYAEIVQRTRGQIGTRPELHFDARRLTLHAGGKRVPMGLTERVWYGFFVQRAARGQTGFGWRNTESRDTGKELLDFTRGLDLELHGAERDLCRSWLTANGEIDTPSADRLTTRVNKQLAKTLGPGPAAPYKITKEGRRGDSRYRITLPPESIHLTEPGP